MVYHLKKVLLKLDTRHISYRDFSIQNGPLYSNLRILTGFIENINLLKCPKLSEKINFEYCKQLSRTLKILFPCCDLCASNSDMRKKYHDTKTK